MSGPLILGAFVFSVVGSVHVVRALIALPAVKRERRRREEWQYQHSVVVEFVRPNGSNQLRPIVEYARPDAIASGAAHTRPRIRQIIPDYAPTHMLTRQDLLVLVNPNDPYQVGHPAECLAHEAFSAGGVVLAGRVHLALLGASGSSWLFSLIAPN